MVHHAVVGGDHQDDDVGGVGSPGPHGGEGSVTGRVQEGDLLTCGERHFTQTHTHIIIIYTRTHRHTKHTKHTHTHTALVKEVAPGLLVS